MTDKALAARLREQASLYRTFNQTGYDRSADLERAADLIYSMAQSAEPVATVHYPRTGGNVGVSWRAIPEAGAMPKDGAKLYLAPPAREPLSAEQVFADDGIMAANARLGLPLSEIMEITRAVEQAHGIRSEK